MIFVKPPIKRWNKYSIFRILGNEMPPRDEPDARLRVLEYILENEPKFPNASKCWIINCIADRERREHICKMLSDRGMYYIVVPLWRAKYLEATTKNDKITQAIGINRARNLAIDHGHVLSTFTFVLDGDCFFTQKLWDETTSAIETDQITHPHRQYYSVPSSRTTFEMAKDDNAPHVLGEPMTIFKHNSTLKFDESIPFGEGDKLQFLFQLNHNREYGKNYLLLNENLCKSVGVVHHITGSSFEIEENTKLRISLRTESINRLIDQLDNPLVAFPKYAARGHGKPNEYWKQIKGYFDFRGLYSHFAWSLPTNAKFVEVGSWQGASTCYLATEIRNRQKEIQLYAVDTWKGSDEIDHIRQLKEMGGSEVLFQTFKNHMKIAGVDHIVKPIRMTSVEAARQFEDESLDAVFIDASHKYQDVLNDIKAWYPKIKPNGRISGHDYVVGHKVSEAGVIRAVHEFFRHKHLEISPAGRTWLHVK